MPNFNDAPGQDERKQLYPFQPRIGRKPEALRPSSDLAIRAHQASEKPVTVIEARKQLSKVISSFLSDCELFKGLGNSATASPVSPPRVVPRLAVQAPAGLGKTRAIFRELAGGKWDRATMLYLVPHHDLTHELVTLFNNIAAENGASARARAYLSRGVTGMCEKEKLPLTADLFDCGMHAQDALCKDGDKLCCFFEGCRYQNQLADKGPGLIVAAHNWAFLGKPPIIEEIDLLVIDEAFWGVSLNGSGGSRPSSRFVKIQDLQRDHEVKSSHDKLVDAERYLIADLGKRAAKVILELGYISPRALLSAGLTTANITAARVLEEAMLTGLHVTPDMPTARQSSVIRAYAQHHKVTLRMLHFWRALEKEIESNPLREKSYCLRFDSTTDIISMLWSSDFSADYDAVPILYVDATMDINIVRRFMPDMPNPTVIECEWPSDAVLIQVPDSAYSKERQKSAISKRDMREHLEAQIAISGGPWGFISNQDFVEKVKVPVLEGLVSGHFGKIRGLNRFNEIVGHTVVGRTIPTVLTLEDSAKALLYNTPGVELACLGDVRYPTRATELRRRDGSPGYIVDAEYHPDHLCNGLLQQTRNAEVFQAIGRSRPLDRSASNPIAVIVFNNVQLPIGVDAFVLSEDLLRNRLDHALATSRTGTLNLSLRTLALLLGSKSAAKRAISQLRAAETGIAKGPKAIKYIVGWELDLPRYEFGPTPEPVTRAYTTDDSPSGRPHWARLAADTPLFRTRFAEAQGFRSPLRWLKEPDGAVDSAAALSHREWLRAEAWVNVLPEQDKRIPRNIPRPYAEMISLGIIPHSPRDMFLGFPEFWKSPLQAKQALKRARVAAQHASPQSYFQASCPEWPQVTYKIVGRPGPRSTLSYDPSKFTDASAREWMAARVGHLAVLLVPLGSDMHTQVAQKAP